MGNRNGNGLLTFGLVCMGLGCFLMLIGVLLQAVS